MFSFWLLPVLVVMNVYQAIALTRENKQAPPGHLITVGKHRLHLWHLTSNSKTISNRPTVVIDHSLGGVEGYLLIKEIAQIAEVCLCDRAGYGWSEVSTKAATSEESVRSLDIALTKANIKPPYILVGNSLGSYNMRLYAHRFPKKVVGMVLTDGLHEKALLKMPVQLRLLQLLFFSGFIISIAGSTLGIIRAAARFGLFKLLKPELKQTSPANLRPVIRSFCRPKHWLTMAREVANIDNSGQQLKLANNFGSLPIVNIKARYFFKPTWLTRRAPLEKVEQLREEMHADLMTLSTRCTQLPANSSHFVWIDQPEVIMRAVKLLLGEAHARMNAM